LAIFIIIIIIIIIITHSKIISYRFMFI